MANASSLVRVRSTPIADAAGFPWVFKASFDKANRTSLQGFRGPGIAEGLQILARLQKRGFSVLTDIHEPAHAAPAAEAVDILQIPAFLCRQTDLLLEAGRTGKIVNVKKGQFLAPWDVKNIAEKLLAFGNDRFFFTERGVTFGYNNLVADMRSLAVMRATGCPVVFDATHSVQLPGGKGDSSGGQREFVPVLARAAVAAGVAGIFMETHPDPAKALSDGPNAWPLDRMKSLLTTLAELDTAVQRSPFEESLL